MRPSEADLAVRVEHDDDWKRRPVGVAVIAQGRIIAEVSIAKVRKIVEQINVMEDGHGKTHGGTRTDGDDSC